ncbi:hypothetical protein JOB18_045094 [Solea senegalensis]|uniref:Anti-proliferative protein domain-containing protein n=2 Tax=Solea senegalensis TaxID=28829 RepID=A0AAV6RWL2_SOLSE|nr:hypothetical protein JOB18_045094 [Solea senegalensis]
MEAFGSMREETVAVLIYLRKLLNKIGKLDSYKVEPFLESLGVSLQEKFRGHWYPENPSKGQAYRCIRVNRFSREDPVLLQACRESGVQYSDLGLPRELTLWIDPGEVCCRYGEGSMFFSLATFSTKVEDKGRSHTRHLTTNTRHCSKKLNGNASEWYPKKMVPVKQ